jgi:hypothetical protein
VRERGNIRSAEFFVCSSVADFLFIVYEVTVVCGIWFLFIFSVVIYVLPVRTVAVVVLQLTFGFVIHRFSLHFLGVLTKLRKSSVIFVMSVCAFVCPSAWNNSAPTERIFMKFDITVSFQNLS